MKCLSILALFLVLIGAAHAQTAASLTAEGDALDARLQTEAALKVYLQAEKLDPNNPSLLIKIAKQYGESMTGLSGDEAKLNAGETALAYAQRAHKLEPGTSNANLAVSICYGRLLKWVPVKTRVEYSRQVHDYAEKAAKLDPSSDYAWHMLGRWNQAVATMGFFTQGIVRLVYGSLPDASLEKSRECFEKALKIKQDRVCHHIELGRTLAYMGRKEEARKQIEAGLALPDRERDDPQTKNRGRETLKEL